VVNPVRPACQPTRQDSAGWDLTMLIRYYTILTNTHRRRFAGRRKGERLLARQSSSGGFFERDVESLSNLSKSLAIFMIYSF